MLVAADGTLHENNRVFPFGEPWHVNVGSDNDQRFTAYESGLAVVDVLCGIVGSFLCAWLFDKLRVR
jgi:hypothetical protein